MTSTTSRRKRYRWHRALIVTATFVGATGSFSSRVASAAGEPAVDVGAVVVVEPYDQSKELTHGDANTEFSVRLPDGATCPGDSANDQWRVQSFIIPTTDDPDDIQYGAIGPEPPGAGRYALFDVETVPFVHELTIPNPGAGQPGVIPPMRPLSFAVVAGEEIPNGRYRIGVACSYFGDTTMYWDTDIVITNSTEGELDWRLASAPEDVGQSDDGPSLALAIVIVVGGLGVVAVGFLLWRRGVSGVPTLSQEPS